MAGWCVMRRLTVRRGRGPRHYSPWMTGAAPGGGLHVVLAVRGLVPRAPVAAVMGPGAPASL